MKILPLSMLLVAVSCAQISPKQDEHLSRLEAMLSPEDLAIHRCLGGELKAECLKGTAYEGSKREPSSDDNAIIMKNNWFFDSAENLEKFYQVSRGFLKAQARFMAKYGGRLVNKKGIAVEGSVYAGVGRGWAAEFAVHDNKLGFFCAPSWSVQSDIGVDAEIAVSRSLSCPTNKDYAGQDVSFGAGISGELIGLPVGVGIAYGMSIDSSAFRQRIAEARRAGLLNIQSITRELAQLNSPGFKQALSTQYQYALPLLTLALKPLGVIDLAAPALANRRSLTSFAREMMRNDRSVSALYKTFYHRQLKHKLLASRLTNLNAFLGALEASVTGCDTMSAAASAGVSLLPAAVSVTYSETHLLAEASGADLATFAGISAMALLNPFLLPSQDLRNVVKVARSFVMLPQKVQRQCLR